MLHNVTVDYHFFRGAKVKKKRQAATVFFVWQGSRINFFFIWAFRYNPLRTLVRPRHMFRGEAPAPSSDTFHAPRFPLAQALFRGFVGFILRVGISLLEEFSQ